MHKRTDGDFLYFSRLKKKPKRCECGGIIVKAPYPDDLHWQVCDKCGQKTKQAWCAEQEDK